jgi:hypothetical protein
MPRVVAIRLAILVVLVAWPPLFTWLADVDAGRGSIWLALHRVYYLPFSWVGPPMFDSGAAAGLSVHPTGRAFAVFAYVLVFYIVVRIVDRRKLVAEYGHRESDDTRD